MEQKYSNFAISLDSMEYLDTDICHDSEYGKITISECIEKRKLPDEVFYCYTFFHEGDFAKNIIQRLSYNFVPIRIFIHSVPEDKETVTLIFAMFRKYNQHIVYSVGNIGWNNDDFIKQNVTIEIPIDAEQTKQL